ncbi:MAG: HugZ family protein [Alphaproteobacteria bacterium]
METTPRPPAAATPAPPPGQVARGLLRGLDHAALATLGAAGSPAAGAPYASLVQLACMPDASPVLLVSRLAEHTRNIEADPRVSLLLDGTAGLGERLTGARLSLPGVARRSDDPVARRRFLARHPGAALYAGFADFSVHVVEIGPAHLVAGFGRIHWIAAGALRDDVADAAALVAAEEEIVAHMNEDHADALGLYANRLLGRAGEGWRMTGIDPEGLDLRREGAGEVARLAFARRATTPDQARAELVRLAKAARAVA